MECRQPGGRRQRRGVIRLESALNVGEQKSCGIIHVRRVAGEYLGNATASRML